MGLKEILGKELLSLAEKEGVESAGTLTKKALMEKEQQEMAKDFLKMNPSLKSDVIPQPPKMSSDRLNSAIENLNNLKNPKAAEMDLVGKNTQDALKAGDPNVYGDDFLSQVLPRGKGVRTEIPVEAPPTGGYGDAQSINTKANPASLANENVGSQYAKPPSIDTPSPIQATKQDLPQFGEHIPQMGELPVSMAGETGATLSPKALGAGAAGGLGLMGLLGMAGPQDKKLPPVPMKMDEPPETPAPPQGMAPSLKARSGDDIPEDNMDRELADSEKDLNTKDNNKDDSWDETPAAKEPSKAQGLADLMAKQPQDEGETFANAQKRKNMATLGNELGSAGDIIGGAIARTGPNEAAQKLFANNVKSAGDITTDFKDKKAMEEHDPNSAVSQNYREFLKRYGVQAPPNTTAAQVKSVLLPAAEKESLQKERLSNQRDMKELQLEQIRATKEQSKAYQDRRLDQTEKNRASRMLEMAKNRAISGGGPSAQRNRNALIAARRMFNMAKISVDGINEEAVDKISDEQLNSLPPNMVAEMVVDMNSMLTPAGVPPQSTFKKLMPKTAKMDFATLSQYVTGEVQPANVASFNRLMLKTAARVYKDAKTQNTELAKKYFSGTEHIRKSLPDDYNSAYEDIVGERPEVQLSTAEKSQVLKFAKAHKMSVPEAEALIKKRKAEMGEE